MTLGYTRTGLAVSLPTRRSPDEDSFTGWTRGDHVDAARILAEHGEREADPKIQPWCVRWAKEHRALGRRSRKALQIRGAAETSILRGRR